MIEDYLLDPMGDFIKEVEEQKEYGMYPDRETYYEYLDLQSQLVVDDTFDKSIPSEIYFLIDSWI